MNTSDMFLSTQEQYKNNTNWQEIYSTLRPIAKRIVYSYHAPAWRGQENDIAEDITQETIRKLLEYEQKVKRGSSAPIHSLLSMVRIIAYNYGKDMLRHDKRTVRIAELEDDDIEQQSVLDGEIDAEELATENAYNEMIFREMARAIASFPPKQRHALLVDIAAHMSFELQPTPLQQAFSNAGIQLQAYQKLLPATPEGYNRHASLLVHAYRRVSTLACALQYREQDDYESEYPCL